MCLYCNERCSAFSSLEGVRKHMEAKSHCKVHYGDGGDDEEGELEDFYDYSSRFCVNFGSGFFLFLFLVPTNLQTLSKDKLHIHLFAS